MGDSWAVASLPHWPGLGAELSLRLGVIDVAECCIDRLGYRLRHEEVWHLAMQLPFFFFGGAEKAYMSIHANHISTPKESSSSLCNCR